MVLKIIASRVSCSECSLGEEIEEQVKAYSSEGLGLLQVHAEVESYLAIHFDLKKIETKISNKYHFDELEDTQHEDDELVPHQFRGAWKDELTNLYVYIDVSLTERFDDSLSEDDFDPLYFD